jgi:hypothetical protein
MKKLKLNYRDETLEFVERTVQAEGFVYARVKYHVERYGQSIVYWPETAIPARFGGIPSVMQRIQSATELPVTLTRELQEWMFSLLFRNAPKDMSASDVKKCWANLYNGAKAYTNHTGWDTTNNDGDYVYADYIQGTGLENSKGFKLQPTVSHGMTIKVLRTFNKAGMVQAAFEVADARNPSTLNLTHENAPHIIMCAVNWTKGWQAGTTSPTPGYAQGWAEPFPKLGGRDVYLPMLSSNSNEGYIDTEWLEYLQPGSNVPAYPYWKKPS